MPTPWCPESGRIIDVVDEEDQRATCHRCGKSVLLVERRLAKHRIPALGRGRTLERGDDRSERRAS
jgi:hypothetical protein